MPLLTNRTPGQTITAADINSIAAEVNRIGATIACRISKQAGQSVATATFTTLTFDTEEFDSGGLFNPATPSRITIPTGQGGLYLLQAQTYYSGGNAGSHQANVVINGTRYVATSNLTGTLQPPSASVVLPLIAGDYVESHAYQASGSSLTILGDKIVWLVAVRLGD